MNSPARRSSSVIAATSAMSSAWTNGSAPSPVGATIAPSAAIVGAKMYSSKSCMNQPGRRIATFRSRRQQVELDRAHGGLRRREVHPAGAERGDVGDARGLRAVQERVDERGVVEAQRRRDEVQPVDALERGVVGGGVVPVEADVGARAGGGADGGAGGAQSGSDAARGLAGAAEEEDRHASALHRALMFESMLESRAHICDRLTLWTFSPTCCSARGRAERRSRTRPSAARSGWSSTACRASRCTRSSRASCTCGPTATPSG